MKRYLFYVLRRTMLVLVCLGTFLLGWPGDVGAAPMGAAQGCFASVEFSTPFSRFQTPILPSVSPEP